MIAILNVVITDEQLNELEDQIYGGFDYVIRKMKAWDNAMSGWLTSYIETTERLKLDVADEIEFIMGK